MVRVVSLLPSATEIVCALGAGQDLVGVSHECDHPPEVAGLPALTIYDLDVDLLAELELLPRSGQLPVPGKAAGPGWPYALLAIARTAPKTAHLYRTDSSMMRSTMMSPNPPKIAHNPLSSQLLLTFLALARAVRTNPASTPTKPSWVNRDGINRGLLAGCWG